METVVVTTREGDVRGSRIDGMHAAWVQFATDGCGRWPKYGTTRRSTMRFDVASGVVADPHAAERRVWEGMFVPSH